jgi:hypothetical protein
MAKQRVTKSSNTQPNGFRRVGHPHNTVGMTDEFNGTPWRSLDFVFRAEAASILPNYAHFFPTKTCVLDRHTEELVFVLLVVGSESVLMEQHQLRVIRACFREFGELCSDNGDEAGLSLHPFVIGHLATRIADYGRA